MTVEQEYLAHASRLKATGIIFDPWIDGAPRFCCEPLILSASRWQALRRAAESVTLACDAVAREVMREPALLDTLGLSPHQRRMWASSAPQWHGIARADACFTDKGIAIRAIASDTPKGEPEAVASSALAWREHFELEDPNERMGERFGAMASAMHAALPTRPALRSAALICPTSLFDDLGFVTLIHRWLLDSGWTVTLGSPLDLQQGGPTGVLMRDKPCDLIVRHFRTDCWGERAAVWKDEPESRNKEPLDGPLQLVLRAQGDGRVAVLNPFGAVVTHNKRAMALMWELIERLPEAARDAVRRHVPHTVRMETIDPEELLRDRAQWVLESDYGCEGGQTIVGPECDDEEWMERVRSAVPEHWIARRYVHALADDRGRVTNLGVYVIGGEACGILCREQAGTTHPRATVVPVLIDRGEGDG